MDERHLLLAFRHSDFFPFFSRRFSHSSNHESFCSMYVFQNLFLDQELLLWILSGKKKNLSLSLIVRAEKKTEIISIM